jgi:hypothetical protein
MDKAAPKVLAAAPAALSDEPGLSRRSLLRHSIACGTVVASFSPLGSGLQHAFAAEPPSLQAPLPSIIVPSGPGSIVPGHAPKQATKLYGYPEPFMRDMRRRRVGDLLNALNLWHAGYHDLSFSPFTKGVIVKTRFERVDELGYHAWTGRFDIDKEGNSGRLDWVARNVFRQTLFYRQFALVITTETSRNPEFPKDFTRQYEAFGRGTIAPDEATRNMRITEDHACYALVYVYSRGPKDDVPRFSPSSPVEGIVHLERANIETGEKSMGKTWRG